MSVNAEKTLKKCYGVSAQPFAVRWLMFWEFKFGFFHQEKRDLNSRPLARQASILPLNYFPCKFL